MSPEDRSETAGAGALPTDVERLAASMVAGETRLVSDLFRANGAAPPVITWSPGNDDLGTPVLQSFSDVCDALATPAGFIQQDRFRLEDFDGLDRWMMLVRRDGPDYRYDHYGAEIVNHHGIDMTGMSTADEQSHIGTFGAALYTSSIWRRERVLSVHEPPARIFVRLWRRLVVPMLDGAGEITTFAVALVPDNELRAGLEMIVDPVFVTDGDGIVQYYNDAARCDFEISSGQRRPLAVLTGIDSGGLPAPEILLARREIVERLELVERRGGIMDRLAISVSAAEHRGRAYYVFLLRTVVAG